MSSRFIKRGVGPKKMQHLEAGACDVGGLVQEVVDAKDIFLKAGRMDLCDWLTQELSGYAERSRPPSYRLVPAVVKGNISGQDGDLEDCLLPVWHLAGDWAHEYVRIALEDIEQFAKGVSPALRQPISSQSHALFSRGLRLGPGHFVTSAWWEIRSEHMSTIVVKGLREELGRQLLALQGAGLDAKGGAS